MALPAAVRALPQDKQDFLQNVVKPKFDAYFEFTALSSRSTPDPGGQSHYVYSPPSLNADLAVLWMSFSDVYQTIGGYRPLAAFVKQDPYMVLQFRRIVQGKSETEEDGSFWRGPTPGGSIPPTAKIPLDDAVGSALEHVLRTLRNGFAHSRWHVGDLAALAYWTHLKWSTANAWSAFDLYSRPKNNWTVYIADSPQWNSQDFWNMSDLRIIVTPVGILRFHLYVFLNYVLSGSKKDVFGNDYP